MGLVLSTLPQITVTTSGTNKPINGGTVVPGNVIVIYLSAPSTNTGSIWVGDSSVAVGRGIEVPKGTTLTLNANVQVLDLNKLYVDASTSGDKVSLAYQFKVS